MNSFLSIQVKDSDNVREVRKPQAQSSMLVTAFGIAREFSPEYLKTYFSTLVNNSGSIKDLRH